jgi:hypothetical protein
MERLLLYIEIFFIEITRKNALVIRISFSKKDKVEDHLILTYEKNIKNMFSFILSVTYRGNNQQ